MAAEPGNDILTLLDTIENNIRLIITALGQQTINWVDVRNNIDNLHVMIQRIINNPHNHTYLDRLREMNDAVGVASEAARSYPQYFDRQPDYDDIRGPLQDVIDHIIALRITIQQHVGGYRKRRAHRKHRTHIKRRTQRKRNRRRTHRSRK